MKNKILFLALLVFLLSQNSFAAGQDISYEQSIAKKFAPILRFDSKQGDKNKCFPSDAETYYETRKHGGKSRICNEDYETIKSNKVPTYFQYASSGNAEYIMYWFFYGYQDTCSPGLGSHDADWERITVKVVNGNLDRVLFFQHKGQYTRKPGRFEKSGNHPIVYIGKNSHGSYHDSGGSGTCCYWEDFRKPGEKDQKLETWNNLVRLSNDENSPEWMRYNGTDRWDGLKGPLFRDQDNDLTKLQGCRGAHTKVCHTGGCYKSDIGDKPF